MALNGFIYDERNNRAKDWGNVFRALFPDGILTGCAISFTANSITIGTGYFMSGGRAVQVDGATTTNIAASIQNGYVRLIYETDLTQPASGTTFAQGVLSYDFSATTTFPELVQDDINGAGTTYQSMVCIAQVTGGNIVGIVQTMPTISLPFQTTGGTVDGDMAIDGDVDINGNISANTGTVTGTMVLSKTTDASGTANNSPALIVGGTATQQHIEMDGNEIISKSNATTPGPLYINGDGGLVGVGPDGMQIGGPTYVENVRVGRSKLWEGSAAGGTLTVPGISDYMVFRITFAGNDENLATGMVCASYGSNLVGSMSSTPESSMEYSVYLNATVVGDTLRINTIADMTHFQNGQHGPMETGSIKLTSIWGIA